MTNASTSFEFTVEIYGLCVVNEGSASSDHGVIAVDTKGLYDEHELFLVVHERHVDREKTDDVLLKAPYSYRQHQHTYFHFPKYTQIEISQPWGKLSRNWSDSRLRAAELQDLGLGPLETDVVGTDPKKWHPGVLGRILLPFKDSSSGWRDPLGEYIFKVGGAPVGIADMFFWGGQYRTVNELRIAVNLDKGSHVHALCLKNRYTEDFAVGMGCVYLDERLRSGSANPFGYRKAFKRVAKGTLREFPPVRVPPKPPLFPEHMGSSSCPPIKS